MRRSIRSPADRLTGLPARVHGNFVPTAIVHDRPVAASFCISVNVIALFAEFAPVSDALTAYTVAAVLTRKSPAPSVVVGVNDPSAEVYIAVAPIEKLPLPPSAAAPTGPDAPVVPDGPEAVPVGPA